MQCKDFEWLYYDAALNEASDIEARRLQVHSETCTACRNAEAEVNEVVGKLRNECALPAVSPLFMKRLDRAVEAGILTARNGERRFSRRLVRVSAAVACTCAAIGLGATAIRHIGLSHVASQSCGAAPATSSVWKIDNIAAYRGSAAQMPVASNGKVYVVEKNGASGRIISVDTKRGVVLWRSSMESYGYLGADSCCVVGVVPGKGEGAGLAAYDGTTGKLLWQCRAGQGNSLGGFSAPLVAGDAVCWAHGGGLELLDKKSGSLRWRRLFATGGAVSHPALDDGKLFVASGTTICCLSEKNRVLWIKTLEKPMSSLMVPLVAVAGGKVFVAHRSIDGCSQLLCLDERNGTMQWIKSDQECSSMLAVDGSLYLRSHNVRAIDPRTGWVKWSSPVDGCAPLCCSGNLLYVSESAEKGILLSLDTENGTIVRQNQSFGSCTGVIVADGLEIIHSIGGAMYAFRQAGLNNSSPST